MESLLETRLNGYVLARVIASGGMAAVFEGRHEVTGQVVAIKVLSRDLRNKRDPLARILQEGRAIWPQSAPMPRSYCTPWDYPTWSIPPYFGRAR